MNALEVLQFIAINQLMLNWSPTSVNVNGPENVHGGSFEFFDEDSSPLVKIGALVKCIETWKKLNNK